MVEITSKVAESFLTKVFNETPEELYKDLIDGEGEAAKLKDDADNILINRYNEKIISKFKKDGTEKFTQGINKATKEQSEKVINLLKQELGYDANETDLEKAFQIVKEKINSKLKNPLTDDQVKAHKLYLEVEKKLKDDTDKLNKEWEGKLNAVTSEFQKKENFARISDSLLTDFHELNPVLPTNEIVKKNQIGILMNNLKTLYDYQFDNNGNSNEPLILFAGTDKRVESQTGHPITRKELVKIESAKMFEFKAQDDKGNTGNDDKGGGTDTFNFKDEEDYRKQYSLEKDIAKRIKMQDAWTAKNKK